MNEKFDLPDGFYSVLNIPDYFEYILKDTDKRLTENRVTFNIKTAYYLQFLMPKMMKLLGSIKKVNKNKNRENVPRLKTINAVLIH